MSRRLHVWWYLSVNAFKFQSCDHTPPRTRSLTVSLGLRARPPPGWYRLGREIKRYLIIVYPRTFALDQRDAARGPPALPGVLAGSSYFTRPRRIPPAPRRPLSRPPILSSEGPAVLRWPVQRTCRERSAFLTVAHIVTAGYERFNCNSVREGCQ